VIRSEP